MRTLPLAAVAALALTLSAQSNPIAYPADTVRAGSGNLAPFGLAPSSGVDEARWQQLILAHYLPSTACTISGMAVTCQSSTAAVPYTSLIITLSETTATTLGNSFSGNLPAPVTVLNASNFTIQWSINNWVVINFTTPFVFSGGNNLVVSIQKLYDRVTNPVPGVVTHQTTGAPHRTDLVPAVYAFSGPGGGGSTTNVASFSSNAILSMRLLCDAQGTATLRSVSQPTGAEYSIGTSAEYVVWGVSGTPWAAFLDTALRPPLSLPFFQGRLYVIPSLMFASGQTSGGSSAMTIPIPSVNSIVGSYWTLQSATLSPTLFTIATTNVADFFVTS